MAIPYLVIEHTHTSQETTALRLNSWEVLFMCILPWWAPSALNSGLLKSGCILLFCLVALSKCCRIFESKVSIQVDCFELLLHPGSIQQDDFYYLFTLPTPGRTFSSLYSKSSRCQNFPEWAFLWCNPFLLNREPCTHLSTLVLKGLPWARTRSWWQTSVDIPHVAFLSLLEQYLISTGCLFPDLCLLPTWIETINFLQGLILLFTLTPFFPHLRILNTYEQMELFLNTVAEFFLTDAYPCILVS